MTVRTCYYLPADLVVIDPDSGCRLRYIPRSGKLARKHGNISVPTYSPRYTSIVLKMGAQANCEWFLL
jgi:hypothetical protein